MSYVRTRLKLLCAMPLFVLALTQQGCTDKARPATADPAKSLAAEITAIVEKDLPDWPSDFRSSFVARLLSTIEETKKQKAIPAAWIEEIKTSLDPYLKDFAGTYEGTPEEAEVQLARVQWVVQAFLTAGPPSPEEKKAIAGEIEPAVKLAGDWSAATFPDFPEDLRQKSAADFERGLRELSENVLNPAFLRPLAAGRHDAILKRWREMLASREKDRLLEQHEVFAVIADAAPQWEVEAVRKAQDKLLTSCFEPYLELRIDAFPVESESYRTAMAKYQQSRRERTGGSEGIHNESILSRYAPAVRDYEVAGIICDAICDGSPFEIQLVDDGSGRYTLGPHVVNGDAPIRYSYQIEYAPIGSRYDERDNVPGSFRGFVFACPECARLEVIGRTPSWRTRGIYSDLVGMSLLSSDMKLALYHPGLGHFEIREMRSGDRDERQRKTALDVPRDYRLRYYLLNRQVIASGEVSLVPGDGQDKTQPSGATVVWNEVQPWFYCAWLVRAEYSFRDEQGRALLDHAELYARTSKQGSEASETKPKGAMVAAVRWSDPLVLKDGRLRYAKVDMDILPPALSVWDKSMQKGLAVAPNRRVIWEYRIEEQNGLQRVFPKHFSVVADEAPRSDGAPSFRRGGTAVAAAFDAPVPAEVRESDIEELRAPLPLDSPTPSWRYYALRKDYLKLLSERKPIEPDKRFGLINSAGAVAEDAIKMGDINTAIAAQADWLECLIEGGQFDEWKTRAPEYLELVFANCDATQTWFEASGIVGNCEERKLYDALEPMMALLSRGIRERYSTMVAFAKGGLTLGAGSPGQSVACFDAALVKTADAGVRRRATFGRGRATARLCDQLIKKHHWPIEEVRPWIARARNDIERFKTEADDEEKANAQSQLDETTALLDKLARPPEQAADMPK